MQTSHEIKTPITINKKQMVETERFAGAEIEATDKNAEFAGLSEEVQLTGEDLRMLAMIYELPKGELDVFDDTEILISHQEELEQLTEQPGMFETEDDIAGWDAETIISPLEMVNVADLLTQVNLPIEEIESSLLQAAEVIESSQPEIVDAVNGILDKILALQAKLDNEGEVEIIEAEIQEKIEVLFTELFDWLGINYTPELIESLARLTIRRHLGEKMQSLKQEEETDEKTQGYGTHEIIKKLLSCLRKIKKTMANVYVIGKSILRLYRFDCPTELRKRLTC